MCKRTKIVATLGPATDDSQEMDAIIRAGVDVVRVNFSHGSADEHRRRVNLVRQRAAALNRHVGVLGDLQGPKIRVERFAEGKVELVNGAAFALDGSLQRDAGDQDQVGITYKQLPQDVAPGDTLILDDGLIELCVESISGERIQCRVTTGGILSDGKGINRQGGGLTAPALTEKDIADISLAAELEVDFLAVSFPRCGADLEQARSLMRAAGGDADIVAKIERQEAVDALEEVIEASDVVMIARGDLGVEIGDARLPGVQKRIARLARQMDKVVITATQMMESMITSPMPTRAEVLDVANAVIDGTDAVMLSAETAVGKHPGKVVATMARICEGAEQQQDRLDFAPEEQFGRVDEAVAKASIFIAKHFDVKAIVALTESGATPRWMSRVLSDIPIYALTPHLRTCRKATICRGVIPVIFEMGQRSPEAVNAAVVETLLARDALQPGELAIVSKGDLKNMSGGTNALKLIKAPVVD